MVSTNLRDDLMFSCLVTTQPHLVSGVPWWWSPLSPAHSRDSFFVCFPTVSGQMAALSICK